MSYGQLRYEQVVFCSIFEVLELQKRRQASKPTLQVATKRKKSCHLWLRHLKKAKGQLISKGVLMSSISSKKRTKEFDFTTMIPQIEFSFVFLEEMEDTKKPFQNYLTFSSTHLSLHIYCTYIHMLNRLAIFFCTFVLCVLYYLFLNSNVVCK